MKRVLLTAVALLFGAAAFAQPSASVETLARKYADRDGALVMRLDSTMVGLVKLRVAALPDSLRRSAALLDKVSGMTNIMLMTGLARTLDPAADTTAFVRLESDRARRATERKNLAVFSACREKSLLLCHLIVLLRCKPIFW